MKQFFESIIATGNYNLDDLTTRMTKCYALGRLTEAELTDLIALATENAQNAEQVDVYAQIVDLQHRVAALEQAGYVVWTPGYTTRKGEIVRYDVTGDGNLDLCQYDGGRTETALGIGKIDGWYLLDEHLNKTATITKDGTGAFVIGPIAAE